MAEVSTICLLFVYETVNYLVNVRKVTTRLRIPFAGTWTIAVESAVKLG